MAPEPSPTQEHNPLARLFFGRIPLAVAASLKSEPHRWRRTPCWLIHDTGLHLWTNNGAYGMELCDGWMGPRLWGSVTLLSSVGLSPGHWLLRRAADRFGVNGAYALDALARKPASSQHEASA